MSEAMSEVSSDKMRELKESWSECQRNFLNHFEVYQDNALEIQSKFSLDSGTDDVETVTLKLKRHQREYNKISENLGGVQRNLNVPEKRLSDSQCLLKLERSLFDLKASIKAFSDILKRLSQAVLISETSESGPLSMEDLRNEKMLCFYRNEYELKESIINSLTWNVTKDIFATYKIALESEPFLVDTI